MPSAKVVFCRGVDFWLENHLTLFCFIGPRQNKSVYSCIIQGDYNVKTIAMQGEELSYITIYE